jgi:hypothetical protein
LLGITGQNKGVNMKQAVIKILKERQKFFDNNHNCNNFEANMLEVAIKTIDDLVPPENFVPVDAVVIPADAVQACEDLSKEYYCGHLHIKDEGENFAHAHLYYKCSFLGDPDAMAKINADDLKDIIARLTELHKRISKPEV